MLGWWKDEDIKAKLGVIPALPYARLDAQLWELLKEEGLPDEFDVRQKEKWRWAELPLSADDRQGLRASTPETIEKFNNLDVAIKATFGRRYTDLVDYQAGMVAIFRCDGFESEEAALYSIGEERH